jgi:hypothetical protein
LIKDKKIALVDTVHGSFTKEMIGKISARSLTFRWVPTNEMQKCFDYGKEFTKKLRNG